MLGVKLCFLLIVSTHFRVCPSCHEHYNVRQVLLSRSRFEQVLDKAAGKRLNRRVVAMARFIAFRESNLKTNCRERTSSAYGLFQLLRSTRRRFGGSTTCPVCQTRAFLKYVKSRYRTIERAYRHEKRFGYY